MKEDRLERICEMVRSLKEEGGPTMSVGAGGYTGAADPKGPVAGYDAVLGKVDRRRRNQRITQKNMFKCIVIYKKVIV